MKLSENALLTLHAASSMVKNGFINKPAALAYVDRTTKSFDVRKAKRDPEAVSLSGGNLQKFQVGREILREHDFDFLVKVADKLFSGRVLEEKVAAVFLLEKMDAQFGDREFRLFESWLDRISSWADHDGLVHYLIAPMVAAKPARVMDAFRWAKSPKRWHRRAACVAMIRGARSQMFFPEIVKLSDFLLTDQEDMVQKGLGWLLRETTKYDPKRTLPYLMKIRARAPRLVLRTACETLPKPARARVLGA